MPASDGLAKYLLELYRTDIRPFLAEHEVANLPTLDQNAEMLARALAQTGELRIGFVGESQVGKSTLVNALLDRQALPSGGIGPLTAQATRVEYAQENGLTVKYHAKQQLHQHAFAIARYLERRGDIKRNEKLGEGAGPDEPELLPETELTGGAERLLDAIEAADDGDGPKKEDLGRYMLNQAKRILHFGNPPVAQDNPTDVMLLDGLRAVLGQKTIGPPESLDTYRARVAEVQGILGQQEALKESTEGSSAAFNRALRLRAAGWMSPLVNELHLRLNSPMLRSLSLVDLPGIGVLNDPAGREAEAFVRTEGDALVIVFRNNGVTETVAELLERTGVITKMLFGGTGEVPPIQIVIAVTHLDDVAQDRYRVLAQEARDNGDGPPDRHRIFQDLSQEMGARLREMIGEALRRSQAFEDLPEDQRVARERAVATLTGAMQIFCVASPDYLNQTQNLEEGLGFLRDIEVTNVPDLRRHLIDLAQQASARRKTTIVQFERALHASINDHLAAIAQMYEEGRGAATQEFERFRGALTEVAEPLRLEMRAYHGEALGMLRKAMSVELQMVCKDAEVAAMKKLQRLTREGRGLHYATLKAALVRDGVWERRSVNYPDALTLTFVDSIAANWEPRVVEKVREEVRVLAKRDLKLVEALCDAARTINARIVAESPIDAQKRILEANSRTAVAWTGEQLSELRDNVQKTLRLAVQRPIEKACRKAVKEFAHIGSGAKNRILEAFEDGGQAAIDQARAAAEESLKQHYGKLLRRLDEGFLRENHDPVQAALDTLTGEQVTKARRSDAQRKRIVTTRVAEFGAKLRERAESA
jgi:hypothetical protein